MGGWRAGFAAVAEWAYVFAGGEAERLAGVSGRAMVAWQLAMRLAGTRDGWGISSIVDCLAVFAVVALLADCFCAGASRGRQGPGRAEWPS